QAYVRAAMQQGYSILVFPGGGREVLKRQGEQYQLIWKQRYGFLKLAQEFNYDLVPFAALGADEVYEIGFNANKIIQHKYFQTLLKLQQLNELVRHADVITSQLIHRLPNSLLFYFQFIPRLPLAQVKTQEELI